MIVGVWNQSVHRQHVICQVCVMWKHGIQVPGLSIDKIEGLGFHNGLSPYLR